MKKIICDKKVLIGIVFIVLGIILFFIGIFSNQKKDKITQIEDAIENVFFYLPNTEYNDLNEISDYCKISMVFDTDYLKKDAYLSKDDYDTITKSKKNSVKAFKASNVLKSLRNILGDNATINFDLNDDDDYEFLLQDSCKYGNKNLKTLSYNESRKYFYSIDDNEENNSKLYVKWDKPKYDGDTVILTAYALLSIKNNDGGYDIYLDSNLHYKIDSINGVVDYKIGKLYDQSFEYKFTLKKDKDNYIWTKYEVITNIDDTVIYD